VARVSSAAVAAYSTAIFKSILSILEKVPSRFVSSAVSASTVAASAGAALVAAASSAAGVFDTEAGGGVSSMTSITVIILRLFGTADFLAAEESSFCKTFVRCGPSGLSLIGKDSVITIRISSTSAAEGVEGASSSSSVDFGLGAAAFLFFGAATFCLGLDFFSSEFLHLLLPFWQLVCSEH
jgi:hypothetical protein